MLFSTIWSVDFLTLVNILFFNQCFLVFYDSRNFKQGCGIKYILLFAVISGMNVSFNEMYLKSNAYHLICRMSDLILHSPTRSVSVVERFRPNPVGTQLYPLNTGSKVTCNFSVMPG